MFTNKKEDLTQTLGLMINKSMEECRFNQSAAVEKVAQWVSQDRRFDNYDPGYVAREAFDARSHGRSLQLDKPYQTNSGAGTSVV